MTDDPNRPVVLLRVASEIQAAQIAGLLQEHGIRALVTGGHTAGFRAEAPGDVQVVVRQQDAQEARRLLEELAGGQSLPNEA